MIINSQARYSVQDCMNLIKKGVQVKLDEVCIDLSDFDQDGLSRIKDEIKNINTKIEQYKPKGKPDSLQASLMNLYTEHPVDARTYDEQELIRQREKALSNNIGNLNELMLLCLPKMEKSTSGQLDLIYDTEYLIEVKNRYNSMNAGGQIRLYNRMKQLVNDNSSKYFGYKAVLVIRVHRKKLKDFIPFAPSDSNTSTPTEKHSNVVEIDLESFMIKLSKDKFAYHKLQLYILDVLADLGKISKTIVVNFYLSLMEA